MMLRFLVFAAMNALVFSGAALVVRFGLALCDRLAIVLGSALLGWVYIVLGLELLGLFGQIRLIPSLALATCALGAGLVVYWLRCSPAKPESTSPVLLNDPRPHAGPVRIAEKSSDSSRIVQWAWLAIAAMTIWSTLDVLTSGLINPVLPVSDAPIYHLFFAVRWWQTGGLETVATPFGDSAAAYFPASASVWFTWLILPWSSELVAKVGQWPFLWMGMAAVFGLACEVGVRRLSACFAGALWGTGTLPLLNSGFADVDLVMAACYLVSTWFLVRYARAGQAGDLIGCALGMGAALGTKYIAILYVPWPLAAAAIAVWRRRDQRWLHGSFLMLGVAIPAGYWYLQNLLLTGNPLYPLHVEVLGVPLLHGWYRRAVLLTSEEYHIPVANLRSLYLLLLRGLDPLLLPVWLGGIVAALNAVKWNRRLTALLVLLGLLHIALFWTVNPYQTQDRFLFAAFALLAVPSALAIERVPLSSIPFAVLLACHLTVGPAGLVRWFGNATGIQLTDATLPPLLPALLPLFADSWSESLSNRTMLGRLFVLTVLAIAVFIGSVALRRGRGRFAWAIMAGLMVATGIGVQAHNFWIPAAHAQLRFVPVAPQVGYTPGWLVLEQLSRRPLRVAYAGTNLPFYLFGSRLQNDVQYVNINRHAEYRMHDYHNLFRSRGEPLAVSTTPDWDRREPDEAAWLDNLRDQKVDLLFVGFVNRAGGRHNFYDTEGFPIERTWADQNPHVFQPIHADARTRLYSVRFTARRSAD